MPTRITAGNFSSLTHNREQFSVEKENVFFLLLPPLPFLGWGEGRGWSGEEREQIEYAEWRHLSPLERRRAWKKKMLEEEKVVDGEKKRHWARKKFFSPPPFQPFQSRVEINETEKKTSREREKGEKLHCSWQILGLLCLD